MRRQWKLPHARIQLVVDITIRRCFFLQYAGRRLTYSNPSASRRAAAYLQLAALGGDSISSQCPTNPLRFG